MTPALTNIHVAYLLAVQYATMHNILAFNMFKGVLSTLGTIRFITYMHIASNKYLACNTQLAIVQQP